MRNKSLWLASASFCITLVAACVTRADSISLPNADTTLKVLTFGPGISLTYTAATGEFNVADSTGPVGLFNAATNPNPIAFSNPGVFSLDVILSGEHMVAGKSSPALSVSDSAGAIFKGEVPGGPNFEYSAPTTEFDLLFTQSAPSTMPQVQAGDIVGVQLFVQNETFGANGPDYGQNFTATVWKADAFVVASPLPTTAATGVLLLMLGAIAVWTRRIRARIAL